MLVRFLRRTFFALFPLLFLCLPGLTLAQKVTITPGYQSVATGQKVQYTATVTGLANSTVTWWVSNLAGGNATVGTISAVGLYSAPATVPTGSVTIMALASDGRTSASVGVNVGRAGPTILSFSPSPVYTGSYTITLNGSGFQPGMTVMAGATSLATVFLNSSRAVVTGVQGTATAVAFQVMNPGTLWGPALSIVFKSRTPQTISPAVLSLPLGGRQQFVSAGATGWSASVGTITSGGLYTAPAAMPLSPIALITATGPNGVAMATVTLVATQTISPASVSVGLGKTQQFVSVGAHVWMATVGTITSTGLYTAPAVMPTSKTVTITANGPGGAATAAVTLVGTLKVSPATVALALGKTQQFIAAGATSWAATAGTITATGLYTAPAMMPASSSVTVTATGPGGSASAVVTLVGAQAISPLTASVTLGKTQQFTSAGATSWTATAGTISSAGLYTAPAVMPASSSVTIKATGPGGSATATVTLVAGRTISPLTASVTLGTTQQFTSAGATSWTATAGTISSAGLYTAPTVMPASSSVTITASGAGTSATAVVTLVAVRTISPLTASVTLGKTQQFTSTGATSWTASAGTISSAGLFTAPTVMPASSSVTITATGTGTSAKAVVTLVAVQAISPATVSLGLGKTQQFISAGATSWAATAGTITSAGLYTAPATAISSGTVTITATGPGGSATAKVTLPAAQTISPTSASIYLGTTQLFVSAGATSWTASAGTIVAGLYVAPLVMPASGSATITATGPGGSASATVSLLGTQTILPTSVSLALGGKQQFVSAGATSWTATSGTITAGGLYTAPATATSGSITVTATGPGGSASAAVTIASASLVIKSVVGGTLPLGIFSTTVSGTGFSAQSVASINGVALTTTYKSASSLAISGFSGTAGTASLTVSNGSATSAPFLVTVGVLNPLATPSAARRFLEQGAFGPTPTDAAHVQTIGEAAWIAEQFKMAQVSNYSSITTDQDGMPNHFLTNAVMNPDQLRQRVAFALSQIFVTSLDKIIWNSNMILFQNMLLADSFTNYRQIMADVTLSPAMGQYLDMANNAVADPTIGSAANENYARELMQLFTIGTNSLNADGSMQLDANGLPIPNYVQANISEFARVYTGWTYAPGAGSPVEWGAYITSNGPMVSFTAEHDFGSKQLLRGAVSPAGVTPLQDLNNALDNIFNSPSLAPFVGKQLIQHLVKSNPSPAYIGRVSAVFNDNGKGVKGDMQAVITAILMDPEARANDHGGKDLPTDGHLQEPALFISGMVRAFGGQMTDENYYADELAAMGQDLFNSPSVFNYYAPNYMVPGTGLLGPEFQIHSPNNALIRVNEVSSLMYSEWADPVQDNGPGTTVDLTAYVPLTSNLPTLIDALDLTLMHGTMPAAMKSAVVTAVAAEDGGSLRQVQTACYLILSSNYYNVWH